jgi:hypothetical protein
MRTLSPSRWLTTAGACAVFFFLLGAPQITDNGGTITTIGLWAQTAIAVTGLVALIAGTYTLLARRSTPD